MTLCYNSSKIRKITLIRPYGKDGAPLPWSRQNRRLRPMEEFTVEEMFEIVKHDVNLRILILLVIQMGNYVSWYSPS